MHRLLYGTRESCYAASQSHAGYLTAISGGRTWRVRIADIVNTPVKPRVRESRMRVWRNIWARLDAFNLTRCREKGTLMDISIAKIYRYSSLYYPYFAVSISYVRVLPSKKCKLRPNLCLCNLLFHKFLFSLISSWIFTNSTLIKKLLDLNQYVISTIQTTCFH